MTVNIHLNSIASIFVLYYKSTKSNFSFKVLSNTFHWLEKRNLTLLLVYLRLYEGLVNKNNFSVAVLYIFGKSRRYKQFFGDYSI